MRPVSPADVQPFERCPALWHATRIRKLDAGNRFMRIGEALHVACDRVTRAVLGEDSRELYLVARDAVTEHADRVDMDPGEMHEALDVMDEATSKDSAISWRVPEGWTATSGEEFTLDAEFAPLVGFPENPLDGIAYRSRIDRLQWNDESGELEAWDWSGSHDYVSGEELRLDVRARWDAMTALAWFPAAHVVTFRRVMLRLGYTASAKFVRGERWHGQITDRARRLSRSTNIVLAAMPMSKTGGFVMPERFGGWCGDCPVRKSCKTRAAVLDAGGVPPEVDHREYEARRLRLLKAEARELDERLRADVTAHGPIPLGDGTTLGFHAKRSLVLRADVDAMDVLRQLGMTPDLEREWFAPSDRAMPGLVRDALEKLEKNRGQRKAIEERLLAAGTGFSFEVKETEDA